MQQKFKYNYLIIILTLLFGIISCDKQTVTTEQANAPATTSAKVLKIGSTGQSYPNGFKQNNKLVGFDVEVAEAIAEKLGYQVEWVHTEFGGLIGQLEAERLDTVANAVAMTEARQEKYYFSKPYSIYGAQIVAHKDNNNINTLADFKGKTIAGVLGSNNIKNLEKAFPNKEVEIRTYETRDGAMQDLEFQRVDGYINSKPMLLAEIKRRNLPFKLVGDPIVTEKVAFPFYKNEKGQKLKAEFDQALQELIENGQLKNIAIKYFGEDITTEKTN